MASFLIVPVALLVLARNLPSRTGSFIDVLTFIFHVHDGHDALSICFATSFLQRCAN